MAQVNGELLQSGQLKLRVNADGQLANEGKNASSELPVGSGNHLFKFINLWISGYDAANNLYISTVNGFANKSDYSCGPLDSLSLKGADPNDWNKVWAINATDITQHRQNFKNQGYIPSEAIKNWPANGSGRFNQYLAPFIDYNQDGKYDPLNGDYPDVLGDNALYFICNDNYAEHKASGGQPLKIEIYAMAYTFQNTPNTIFIKYYLINKTGIDLLKIKTAFHAGFELGHAEDNYCGTHVQKNTIFAYNGDNKDEGHYETNMPIAALISLNKPLESTVYITNDTNSNSGMPSIPMEHRLMMEGKWKSGKQVTHGSNGMQNSLLTQFVFPGVTDPNFATTNWVENTTPGQRSMLANLRTENLPSKGFIVIDLAITGFDKSSQDPYTFIGNKVDEIKTNWMSQSAKTGPKLTLKNYTLKSPSLIGENLYESWFNEFESISVYNQLGELIYQTKTNVDNSLIIKQTGIYYISFIASNQILTKKILIL
jgi:hypothetical protein